MSGFVPKVKAREGMDPNPISAFVYALFIVKDEPSLQKYMDRFNNENLDYYSRAYLQTVILFSGALLDSMMVREEDDFLRFDDYRKDFEKDITFDANSYRISFEMLLVFVQTIIKRERKKGYDMHDFLEDAINAAKSHIDKLYKNYLNNQ